MTTLLICETIHEILLIPSSFQGHEKLSNHEKELIKLQSKIEQMEKANLDPKHWTMQGEVGSRVFPRISTVKKVMLLSVSKFMFDLSC